MQSGSEEADALLERIDQRVDLDSVRQDIAWLILKCLSNKRDDLDSWEKMQFEMAIALLPTVWLRLAVVHIKMALQPPDERSKLDTDKAAQFEKITSQQLVTRLVKAMN